MIMHTTALFFLLLSLSPLAQASEQLPFWKSLEPPDVFLEVNGVTQIQDSLFLAGSRHTANDPTEYCWLQELKIQGKIDPVAESLLQGDSSCSFQASTQFQGQLVLLAMTADVGAFFQVGPDMNVDLSSSSATRRVVVPLRRGSMPVGVVASDTRNMIIVASTTPQDLYLHAFKLDNGEWGVVWEQAFPDLVSANESFHYAGMILSKNFVTIAGSTHGTSNTDNSPQEKSMLGFYKRFSDAFVTQVLLDNGELVADNEFAASLTRLADPNDLNEYAYGICGIKNKAAAYIVGQIVRENQDGGLVGSPYISLVYLEPFEIVLSGDFPEIQAGPDFLRLTHCIVDDKNNVIVAGHYSPSLPSRHEGSNMIPGSRRRSLLQDNDSPIGLAKINDLGEVLWNRTLAEKTEEQQVAGLVFDPVSKQTILIGDSVATGIAMVITVEGTASVPPTSQETPEEVVPEGNQTGHAGEVVLVVPEEETLSVLSIVLISVGAFLFCILALFGCAHWSRRNRQATHRKQVMNVFRYLYPFDTEDIDVRKSPAGGFHGTYKNNLAHGENIASAAGENVAVADNYTFMNPTATYSETLPLSSTERKEVINSSLERYGTK